MEKCTEPAKKLVGDTYIEQGLGSLRSADNTLRHLVEQRRLPAEGWSDLRVERCLHEIALMDSNNFTGKVGVGEREGRVYSRLVQRRNYHLAHGMGRSGDIAANQPKAAGSALMCRITEGLVLDTLQFTGCKSTKACVVLPVATGMALLTSLLYFKQNAPSHANLVIWPRIDQKTCIKAPQTAGCEILVVEPLLQGDSLVTDVEEVGQLLELHGDKVLCVMSTTSCFAPRTPDKLVEIAKLCALHKVSHLVNNAYGISLPRCMNLINTANLQGRVDLYVQSLDKNFLVPVGGSVVAGFNKKTLAEVAQMYPGRGSSGPVLDLFITLLSMGRDGLKLLLQQRTEVYGYLKESLQQLAAKHGERVLDTPHNQISLAFTLTLHPRLTPTNFKDGSELTSIGSMLFQRNVQGSRVVPCTGSKTIGHVTLSRFGCHSDKYTSPYITFAAAMGMEKGEVDVLVAKFGKILEKMAVLKEEKMEVMGVEKT